MRIGFLGLGIMGSRMAANLQSAGHQLVVHNRSRDKAEPLLAAGASWAESPAELAREVEIVFSMLAHPEAVEAMATGPQGLLAGMSAGDLWVDCSTVDPSFSRRMAGAAAARGVKHLDAPVAGTREPAAAGQLLFLVGGPVESLERVRALLDIMGRAVNHVGPSGQGSAMKMVINLMLGQAMAAFAEAVALGQSLDIPRERLLDALIGSIVAAPYLAVKRPLFESGDYEAHFPLAHIRKDLQLATRAAYEVDQPLPLTNAAKEIYAAAVAAGHGALDFSVLLEVVAPERGSS